ncbi:MAG: hydroxymethylbilane synthase [Clostridia bacterium]|nr:hydroxymethylbilane synthase [Clostridia bacterium]
MKKVIRVGTRESDLALHQSRWMVNEIAKKHPELEFELVPIKTRGDIILDTRLDKIGGKGLFVKELENALISGEVDIAVHSMKDMPAELPEELVIAALSEREDPRDALVTAEGRRLEDLPEGAVLGTSSIRRELQALALRPDLKVKALRGNVLTRLRKLLEKEYDAVILAAAGLKRLGLMDKASQYFSAEEMVPAVGQGVLCIEARKDEDLQFLTDSVNCEDSQAAVKAERAFMIRLNGGCSTPLGAHAVIDGDKIKMYGMMADESSKVFRAYTEGSRCEASELGIRLADMILKQMGKA